MSGQLKDTFQEVTGFKYFEFVVVELDEEAKEFGLACGFTMVNCDNDIGAIVLSKNNLGLHPVF
jgi:hypothetical protein